MDIKAPLYATEEKQYMEKDRYRKKDWRKSGWARAGEIGLRAASSLHPAAGLAYDAVGAATGWNTEKRCFDQSGQATFTAGVYTATLTLIQQGDDGDQMSGNSVKMSDFEFRFQLLSNTTTQPLTTSVVRLILLTDRENNGGAPALADVLEDTTTPNGAVINSPLNRSNFGRFQIMYDKVHHVGTPGGTSPIDPDINTYRYEELTYGPEKLGEHHITFDDSNSHADANTRKGHVYLMAQYLNISVTTGSLTFSTANPPAVLWWSRVRFYDN